MGIKKLTMISTDNETYHDMTKLTKATSYEYKIHNFGRIGFKVYDD